VTELQVVDRELMDAVSAAARTAPRLRKNHNLHQDNGAACHRLLNAIEPGSYIRPHRHLDPEKDESFVLLRGSLGVITFDERGDVTGSVLLRAGGERVAADVRHGVYHSALALESGTIFFEAKAGPYLPLSDEEKGAFAPEEGCAEAPAYLERLAALFS
jgi:cupin fold WbuC family metalloprotein